MKSAMKSATKDHLPQAEDNPLFLLQVANDGYKAFNKAHTNMDKIRLQTLETPNTLKSALTVLFKVRYFKEVYILVEGTSWQQKIK